MRMVFFAVILILSVTACASGAAATEEPANMEEQPTPTTIPVDLTPAQLAASTALSQNLDLSADEITLVSTEAVDWPDGCLGVHDEGLNCTQALTPGFRIILEANGREVEYHTNEDGTQIRPATVALTWKREGGIAGFCDFMTVYLSGEVHGSSCNQDQYVEQRSTDVLSKEEIAKLDAWMKNYGNISIDLSNPKGVSDRMVVILTLIGTGSEQTLSNANQLELVNFAQDLHQRLFLNLK